jgi:hypothetical protein
MEWEKQVETASNVLQPGPRSGFCLFNNEETNLLYVYGKYVYTLQK